MMLRIASLALLVTYITAAPFLKAGKDTCTAVSSSKCGNGEWYYSCLECGPGQGYNCIKCCSGCKLVSKSGQGYCLCGKGPTPSPPKPKPQPPAPVPGITVTTEHMTFANQERTYVTLMPEHPPTGLIVIVDPVGADYLGYSCPQYGAIANSTGALVVCPAALEHPGTSKSGGKGSMGICWQAWENFGTCGVHDGLEDVNFLAALIQNLTQTHNIPSAANGGKIIMSGMSNGGSMAYRFNCERSELIGGLAIQSQAYFDPFVGFYDYVNHVVPSGTPECKPTKNVPFYSDIGTADVYYGDNVTPGFNGLQKWRYNYSTQVLGCTGEVTETPYGPHEYQRSTGRATCYQYASCNITGAGLNRFCSVPGMGHDTIGYFSLLPAAFTDFFKA